MCHKASREFDVVTDRVEHDCERSYVEWVPLMVKVVVAVSITALAIAVACFCAAWIDLSSSSLDDESHHERF